MMNAFDESSQARPSIRAYGRAVFDLDSNPCCVYVIFRDEAKLRE